MAAAVGRLVATTALVAMAVPQWEAAAAAAAEPPWCEGSAGAAAGESSAAERAALAAAQLGDLAVTAATAATVGRLMAATRLVAMAAPEFSIIRRAARRAVTAARRLAV